MDVDIEACPIIDPNLHIKLFKSATALYHAPSNVSGVAGMHRKVIHATPSWKHGPPQRDCVFVELDSKVAGFEGMNVVQVQMFLSFKYDGVEYKVVLYGGSKNMGQSHAASLVCGRCVRTMMLAIVVCV